jgi:3-dehydroquinate synthase
MALDTCYATAVGLLAPPTRDRILTLLAALGLPTWDLALRLSGPDERPVVLDGLAEFREHLGGELTITLLADIGRGLEVHEMRDDVVLQAIDELARRDAGR